MQKLVVLIQRLCCVRNVKTEMLLLSLFHLDWLLAVPWKHHQRRIFWIYKFLI